MARAAELAERRFLWHFPMVRRPLPLRLIDNVRAEAREFRAALREAPEPVIGWDFLGVRRLGARVWWRLLHEHVAPLELGAAVFVGVMIGLSPFYGLHVVAALTCALLFRLNKLAIWLGTNVSFPVFSPLFAFVSCQIGHRVLVGEPLPISFQALRDARMRDIFTYWLAGFPFLGLALGGLLGLVTFAVAHRRRAARLAASA